MVVDPAGIQEFLSRMGHGWTRIETRQAFHGIRAAGSRYVPLGFPKSEVRRVSHAEARRRREERNGEADLRSRFFAA